MEANPNVVLTRMSKDVLPAFVEDLEKAQEKLAQKPIDNFMKYVTGLLDGIFFEVVQGFGVDDLDYIGEEAAVAARHYAVQALNGALPPEHPYIIALLKLKDDPYWKYMPLYRSHHRQFHEILNTRIAPVITADSQEALDNQECAIEIFRHKPKPS